MAIAFCYLAIGVGILLIGSGRNSPFARAVASGALKPQRAVIAAVLFILMWPLVFRRYG